MLAFSVANPVDMPGIGERQPHSFSSEWLNDAHCEQIYPEAVAAVEEAILNALLAAHSVPTYKPPGRVLEAIEPARLTELMRAYNRLPGSTP